MKIGRQLLFLLIVVALLVGSSPIAMSQDDPDADDRVFLPLVGTQKANNAIDGDVLTEEVSAADQAAVLAFWTRAEIASADGMSLMVDSGPAEMEVPDGAEAEVAGSAGYRVPQRAAANADQVARSAYAADWAAMEVSAADEAAALEAGLAAEAANQPEDTAETDGTRGVYTSYIANLYTVLQTAPPHKYIGRFTFTAPDGNKSCSATAIGGNNIVTAAHCVYDTPSRNSWYTNKAFTPAYRNGSAPYGTFATSACTILTAWRNLSGSYSINGWARYDVAVCTVGRNSAGQTLNAAVGGSGYAWGYNDPRHVFNLGYPSRDYRNVLLSWPGYLRLCAAETFTQAPDTRGMGCNWGPGFSGGPWIDGVGLDSTTYGTRGYMPGRNSGYVTAVNSGIAWNQQNVYGPKFTTNNIRVLCNSRGC